MHRQGYDLQLTQYDERGWRATFYTTGMEHSPTSATGTGWERTPWHATQRAAWEALTRADCAGYETVLFDMASRRARWLANSVTASRVRTSDVSESCWLSFTSRCAASLTACTLSRISDGNIAQRKRWARTASVRSRRH